MLTVYDEDEFIFDALCAGACGYLLKKTPQPRLIESVREAMDGGAPMSPEVARKVIRLFRDIRPPDRADYHLTPHELRLLRMLVEGHNYKTAAADLGVSVTPWRSTCATSTTSCRCSRNQKRLRRPCATASSDVISPWLPASIQFQPAAPQEWSLFGKDHAVVDELRTLAHLH